MIRESPFTLRIHYSSYQHFYKPLITSNMTATTPKAPEEKLPDAAPAILFYLPNFVGALFAYLLERFQVENFLMNLIQTRFSHPYALMGLGIFALGNVNSYLGGSVVNARVQYGVKLPALYANKAEHKFATEFNILQRGHQNFMENNGQLMMSIMSTAILANRPNIAGMMLLIISVCRVLYGMQYRKDVASRMGPFLVNMMTANVGIGYGLLMFVGTESLDSMIAYGKHGM